MRSHVGVFVHVQTHQHERKIAHTNIIVNFAIARVKLELCCPNCNTSDCHLLLWNCALSIFILNETFGMLQQQETLYSDTQMLDRTRNSPKLRDCTLFTEGLVPKRNDILSKNYLTQPSDCIKIHSQSFVLSENFFHTSSLWYTFISFLHVLGGFPVSIAGFQGSLRNPAMLTGNLL